MSSANTSSSRVGSQHKSKHTKRTIDVSLKESSKKTFDVTIECDDIFGGCIYKDFGLVFRDELIHFQNKQQGVFLNDIVAKSTAEYMIERGKLPKEIIGSQLVKAGGEEFACALKVAEIIEKMYDQKNYPIVLSFASNANNTLGLFRVNRINDIPILPKRLTLCRKEKPCVHPLIEGTVLTPKTTNNCLGNSGSSRGHVAAVKIHQSDDDPNLSPKIVIKQNGKIANEFVVYSSNELDDMDLDKKYNNKLVKIKMCDGCSVALKVGDVVDGCSVALLVGDVVLQDSQVSHCVVSIRE